MGAPTAPYCTSAQVAPLLHQLTRGAEDFSSESTPVKAAVETLIGMYAGWINMAFAQIGFYIPFQAYGGETWPEHQTDMLALINAFGTAGALQGPVLKPAPAAGGGRSTRQDNQYTALYEEFLRDIKTSGLGFRAGHRPGTKAETFILETRGPTTDFLEGYLDPTRYQTLREYTTMIQDLRDSYSIPDGGLGWDHLYLHRLGL